MNREETAPKLFISYSWTTPEHVDWAIELATDLRESGVDVILDKWHLREGHDGHAFMEQMVTNKEIKKVLLICDKGYVGKANEREGGVGTETQIITPEIYGQQDQDKFVAIVAERDDDGRAYVPVFYGSRIFIDLSDETTRAENFEHLLRWIFDKPLYMPPPIGDRPAFLATEDETIALGTSSRFRRAVDAIQQNRKNTLALVSEYFECLTGEFEKLRIVSNGNEDFDDLVIHNIESFLPYRNEAIKVFLLLARNLETNESGIVAHRFLEGIIPYMNRMENMHGSREWDYDNFRFIVHELFLYAVACFLRYERFNIVSTLVGENYFLLEDSGYGDSGMTSFRAFRQHTSSIEHRNRRLELNRLSLRADLLEKRSKESGIDFRHLMQADFVLFLRDRVDNANNEFYWWPETLLYACSRPRVFEIFARSQSIRYFNRMKCVLGVDDKGEITRVLEVLLADPQGRIPRWQHRSLPVAHLVGHGKLATKD